MSDLRISIGADNAELNQALAQAEGRIDAFVSKVNKIGEVGDALTSLGGKLTAGITLPLTALGAASIKAYGDIQALEKGLESVMGSAGRAQQELTKLKEVAKLPGLGMKEAVQGSINLQAIGISADKSRKILQQFGNAVATVGKGRVEFERAIYGVQQLANTDFPLGEDLNIIKDALPQVSNLLKEAFGSSRSDELAKMGVSSQQVLDTILTGLGKLPRVTGGIKGAFENFGDSVQTSLARIGKVLDKNLNISNLIDKLTGALDKLVTGFENLSEPMQQFIIGTAAVAASIGPLLVAIGSVISIAPTLISVIGGIKIALLAITGPIGVAVLAITGLATAYLLLRDNSKTAADYQKEWSSSLSQANIEAKKMVSGLDEVWKKTQDVSLSTKERTAAIDELRSRFPVYFKEISNEAILNGTATKSYEELRTSIVNASRAKAAQSELDKRNEERLQKELKLREGIGKALESYYNPKAVQIAGSGGAIGANMTVEYDENQVKAQAKKVVGAALKAYGDFLKENEKADKPLLDFINAGAKDIDKVFGTLGETAAKFGSKFGKGTEGWYEAEIKRLGELKDLAIVGSKEWNNLNSLIEKYQKILNPGKIELPDVEPIQGGMKGLSYLGKIFGDPAEIEVYSNSLVDAISSGYAKLKITLTDSQKALIELNKKISEAWSSDLSNGISKGIGDIIGTMAKSLGEGGNFIQTIGKSVMSMIGNIASQLGQSAISIGIGMIAIKKAFSNPYTAIAAGVALVALGAFISGTVSKIPEGGGSSGSYSGSTGASSSPTYSQSYTSGGGYGGEYVFRIVGNDLVAVLEKNNYKNSRLNAG